MTDDITNKRLGEWLGKWFTIDSIIVVLAMVFIWGGSYANLTDADELAIKEINTTNEKINDMADEQKKMAADVNTIQSDIRVMKNDQVHINNHMNKQEATLNEVVRLLRERK